MGGLQRNSIAVKYGVHLLECVLERAISFLYQVKIPPTSTLSYYFGLVTICIVSFSICSSVLLR